MKKTIIAMMLMAMFSIGTIFAQEQGQANRRTQRTPEERAKAQTERLEKSLKLTAEQKTKVNALFLKDSKDSQKDRENMKGKSREEIQKLFQEKQKKTNAELKKILTDAQYKQYEIDLKKQEAERKNRQPQGQRPQR